MSRSFKDLIREARDRLGLDENEDEDLDLNLSEELVVCRSCGDSVPESTLSVSDRCTNCESILSGDPYLEGSEDEHYTENIFSYDDYKYQAGVLEPGKKSKKAKSKSAPVGGPDYISNLDLMFQKDGVKGFDSQKGFFGPGVGYKPVEKWTSAGGVVMHGFTGVENKYVYVCKPSGGFNGGAWHFPKGKVDPGETKEQAATREVWEEAGLKVKMLPNGYLGKFTGSMSETHFYMMVRIGGSPLKHGWETEQVKAVTLDEAIDLFKKSGNRRDVEVAEKARDFMTALQSKMAKKA